MDEIFQDVVCAKPLVGAFGQGCDKADVDEEENNGDDAEGNLI